MDKKRPLYPKAKFTYIVYVVRACGEGEEKVYKVIDTKVIKASGKHYQIECECYNRTPVVVNEKPTAFKINEQYMLATRDKVWTWMEEEQ